MARGKKGKGTPPKKRKGRKAAKKYYVGGYMV